MAYEGKVQNHEYRLRGYSVALLLLAVFFSGCGGSFQTGGDIAQGRQAMFRGDNQAALGYFRAAAKADPNYIWGTELRKGDFKLPRTSAISRWAIGAGARYAAKSACPA